MKPVLVTEDDRVLVRAAIAEEVDGEWRARPLEEAVRRAAEDRAAMRGLAESLMTALAVRKAEAEELREQLDMLRAGTD